MMMVVVVVVMMMMNVANKNKYIAGRIWQGNVAQSVDR